MSNNTRDNDRRPMPPNAPNCPNCNEPASRATYYKDEYYCENCATYSERNDVMRGQDEPIDEGD